MKLMYGSLICYMRCRSITMRKAFEILFHFFCHRRYNMWHRLLLRSVQGSAFIATMQKKFLLPDKKIHAKTESINPRLKSGWSATAFRSSKRCS